jgi:hypothetical protein
MSTISRQEKTSIRKLLPETRRCVTRLSILRGQEENLWENPPEATSAMKQAVQQFKDRVKNNEQWDGTFFL